MDERVLRDGAQRYPTERDPLAEGRVLVAFAESAMLVDHANDVVVCILHDPVVEVVIHS